MSHCRVAAWQRTVFVGCVLVLVVSGWSACWAQNNNNAGYLLKAGDVIHLAVPGHPNRDLDLILDAAGQVTLPQIGSAQVGGLTVEQTERILRQRLRLVDPSLDAVNISLVQGVGGGLGIHILGEVAHTGEFSFMQMPSLFDLIRAAGGPSDRANMLAARVIRVVDGRTVVHQLNLSGLMVGEEIPEFELRSGDTLIIPAMIDGVATLPGVIGVKVFGGVGVPMVVPLDVPTPLLDVLMLAGTPTEDADLEKIFWVRPMGPNFKSSQINLKKFLEEGDPDSNPLVYPGDTLQVTYYRPSWLRQTLPFVLGSLAAMATIWLAYDRIVND